MSRTEKEKMLAGELYDASAPEIQADLAETQAWLARYNALLGAPASVRAEALAERLGAVGERVEVRPPFHCDYGFNIRIGSGVFLNFNCVILDVVDVTIGDDAQIGPGVQILTADHPRDPEIRASGLEYGRPDRAQRLDRRRRDHPPRRDHRRRGDRRRRQRRHPRRARAGDRRRRPGKDPVLAGLSARGRRRRDNDAREQESH